MAVTLHGVIISSKKGESTSDTHDVDECRRSYVEQRRVEHAHRKQKYRKFNKANDAS